MKEHEGACPSPCSLPVYGPENLITPLHSLLHSLTLLPSQECPATASEAWSLQPFPNRRSCCMTLAGGWEGA
jgi:hypothetical protein